MTNDEFWGHYEYLLNESRARLTRKADELLRSGTLNLEDALVPQIALYTALESVRDYYGGMIIMGG